MEVGTTPKIDHSVRFQTEILTLLKEGVMSGEDLVEDYVEIYSGLRENLSRAGLQPEIPGALYTQFLKDWHRRMKVPRTDWVKQLVPRALFSLGWSYARTSSVLGLPESKIRLFALQAVQEKIGNFPKHLTKECARNDIYLIDVLMGQSWLDPLKIYRPEEFRAHLVVCKRCAGIHSAAKAAVVSWKDALVRTVPAEIDMILKSQPATYGSGFLAFYHRLGWANKLGLQILGSAVVLAAVLLVPFYQKIDIGRYFRGGKTSILVARNEHLPETDEPVSTEFNNDKLSGMNKDGMEEDEPDVDTETDVDNETKDQVAVAPEKPVLTKILPLKPVTEVAQTPKTAVTPPAPVPEPVPVPVPELPPHPPILPWAPKPVETVVAKTSAPEPNLAPTKPIEVAKAPTPAPTPTPTHVEASAEIPETPKIPGKHYFYRWGARSDDPDLIAAGVLKTLDKYQATKAGELALGAEYKGGRYFHFTVDKASYEKLISDIREFHLQEFSSTRSESDRKDLEGKIRIVFWVGPTKL